MPLKDMGFESILDLCLPTTRAPGGHRDPSLLQVVSPAMPTTLGETAKTYSPLVLLASEM